MNREKIKINGESIIVGSIDASQVPLENFKSIPTYKSIIIVGNMKVLSIYKYNKFQKKMIKLFFGFEVEDYE